ncbi:hypothetical protein PIB30_011853 [Stylosanthes scabra]|uniref:F-box protein At3g26010-like beta-propeller domain-containing protein n=1 Tax=Stylosanthes scabra TaxID=79078 RepID=A0ABU6T5S3_9FABA|nr:hypothetical protein [Stylosanthes scabra]
MAISNDELSETLSWLSEKEIHKFKCCSKIFSELSENQYLAVKQAKNALKDSPSCFFLQRHLNSNHYVEFHPLPGDELSPDVPKDVKRFLSASAIKILSSSNGFILCCNRTELFIINPTINSFLHIPLPDHLQTFQQQGFIVPDFDMTMVCDTDDCKVFLFDNEFWGSKFDCHVYSQKEGPWSNKEKCFPGSRDLKFDNVVICNGAIHFVSDCFSYLTKGSPYFRPYIMSYDMANGNENMLRIPKEARRGSHDDSCDMSIFKWSQSQSESERNGVNGTESCNHSPPSESCEHGCDSRFVRFVPYSDTLRPCGIIRAKKNNIDLVIINPAIVIGPLLQPVLNTSAAAILNVVNGAQTFPNASFGWVNAKDVANAHIPTYEIASATGRYFLVERVEHFLGVVKVLRDLYPALPHLEKPANDNPYVPTYQVSKEKAESFELNIFLWE